MEKGNTTRVYSPVTILSENELGQIGTEEHSRMTRGELLKRRDELSRKGWEVIEIQVDEEQSTLLLCE